MRSMMMLYAIYLGGYAVAKIDDPVIWIPISVAIGALIACIRVDFRHEKKDTARNENADRRTQHPVPEGFCSWWHSAPPKGAMIVTFREYDGTYWTGSRDEIRPETNVAGLYWKMWAGKTIDANGPANPSLLIDG